MERAFAQRREQIIAIAFSSRPMWTYNEMNRGRRPTVSSCWTLPTMYPRLVSEGSIEAVYFFHLARAAV
jgi:hypothetical protein